jgi:Tfp pilus assembly protein PilV
MPKSLVQAAQRTTGAALLEALIAVVLLSTGMLSNLSLLNEATAQLTQTLYRQRALNINADLIRVIHNLPADVAVAQIEPAAHNCSEISPCAAAETYASNLHTWQNRITASLPAGRGNISTRTFGPITRIELQINWATTNQNRRLSTSNFAFRTRP